MRIFFVALALVVSCQAAGNTTTTTTTTTTKKPTSKTTKKPGEDRGKRNLYDIGDYSFGRHPAQRRLGYPGHYPNPYDTPPHYVQDQSNFLPDYQYPAPHYPEPPEPIIEIIIKESNETLPTHAPQPYIQKKKKEHVQVFYVNYKKDKNNKLRLETPVAALTPRGYGHREEEEEIIHYPIVTPVPPLKTTTLRTVIHPDSEKYHSNSGIHVTFGTDDKNQQGHQLQEHNEESVVRSVVALPNPNNFISDSERPQQSRGTDSRFGESQYRSDFGQSRTIGNSFNNHPFKGPFPNPPVAQTYVSSHLELPNSNPSQPFRQVHSHEYKITHHQNTNQHNEGQYQPQPLPQPQALIQQYPESQQHQPSQQHHSQQPLPHHSQPLTQHHSQPPPQHHSQPPPPHHQQPPPPHHQQPPPPHHQQLSPSHHQQPSPPHHQHPQHYQQQFPSHHQQSPPSHHQPPPPQHQPPPPPPQHQPPLPQHQPPPPQHQPLPQHQQLPQQHPAPQFKPPAQHSQNFEQHVSGPTQGPAKHSFRFPSQNHHSSAKYNFQSQPLKYRPQQPQHKPIPIPIQNFQAESEQHPFNKQQQFGPPAHAPPPQSEQTFAYENKFNKPEDFQYKQKPAHTSVHIQNNEGFLQQNEYFPQNFGQGGLVQESAPNLSPVHNTFNSQQNFEDNHQQIIDSVAPGSELVKSVPRFEQHITETVALGQLNQPFGRATDYNGVGDGRLSYNDFSSFSNQNNVIQNIPAPHLGPSTPGPHLRHTTSAPQYVQHSPTPQFGQVFSSTPNPNFGHFVTRSPQFVSSTGAPQYHFQTSTPNTQFLPTANEHVQLVTPVPSPQGHYNVQQNQQQIVEYNHNVAREPQIILNSQPRQPVPQKLPPPGHSVSTIHTEALPEIEQRKNNLYAHNAQNDNYVHISGRNKAPTQQQQYNYRESTQSTQSTTTTTTPAPTSSKPDNKKPQIELPDEVPDDLRQQLLSSGILDHADISVLDYDKLGDTALENLPPEHLANFYGAGGGAQISESNRILTVVKPNGEKVDISEKEIERTKEKQSIPKRQNVDLKVVRFDSNNQKSVTDQYIKQDSMVLPTVDVSSDRQYNRYLPLKVSGTQFPIPDASELKGKKISSVVVLAPVDTVQSVEDSSNEGRQERDVLESKEVKFIAGDSLKQLLKKPTNENFKRWLEREAKTDIDFQSVVLLVVKNPNEEQEIYMYDISTKSISRLNGALSTAFVKVAEENAGSDDLENAQISDSGIVQRMSTEPGGDPMEAEDRNIDAEPAASSIHETVVKFSGQSDIQKSNENHFISINSGYSVIKEKN